MARGFAAPVQGEPLAVRIAGVFTRISAHLEVCKDIGVQKQLAKMVMLLPEIEAVGCGTLLSCLEVGVNSLLRTAPEQEVAAEITKSIEERLGVLRNPVAGLRRGSSPAAKVALGMVLDLLVIGVVILVAYLSGLSRIVGAGSDVSLLPAVCFLGALGSFVSIMVRINEFAKLEKTDASVLLLTGIFKPVVGASFALFTFLILLSTGTFLQSPTHQGIGFVLAIAFLAGFGERFAQDVASRAEKAFGQIAFPDRRRH
jgi:hypothetical protein